MLRLSLVLASFLYAFGGASAALESPSVSSQSTRPELRIRVGLRTDAEPFSYRHAAEESSNSISDYRGFIVRVCEQVLREITASGPFKGASIEAKPVTAVNRFVRLAEHEVDMLCGPDSITDERLQKLNASYPVYLSGISYAYPRNFPIRDHCRTVVGVVGSTTAEDFGLRILADRDLLYRFDGELEDYLALGDVFRQSDSANQTDSSEKPGAPAADSGVKRCAKDAGPESCEKQGRYVTPNCARGYEQPTVKVISDHRQAVSSLCRGEILYYVGDVDILKAQVNAFQRREIKRCDIKVEPYTLSREVYAIFFRRDPGPGSLSAENANGPNDALLYAEFNNSLLRLMQGENNILEDSFKREFPDFKMSSDLADFFRNMKITRGWKK